MSITQITSTLGAIPLFAMRTFFPAFLIALFLTYPEFFPGTIENIQPIEASSFFAKNWLLILLGVLSGLEFVGDKIPEVKALLNEFEPYLKSASYLAIELGMLNDNASQVLEQVQWAGFDAFSVLLIFGTLAVFFLATLRTKFIRFLQDIDEDDNLLIGQFISWLEDSLVLFGFLLLIWSGILMIAVYGILVSAFVYSVKKHESKVESQKVSCQNCGEKILPFAVSCFQCRTNQNEISAISLLGQKSEKFVKQLEMHKFNLLAQKRCPSCATKLKKNSPNQICPSCDTKLFEEPSEKFFIKTLNQKFYQVLVLSFLLGLVPIFGFIASVLIAKITLFSPYKKFISTKDSLKTKLFIRLYTFLFFILGIALGFIAAPIFCTIRYFLWKKKFKENF